MKKKCLYLLIILLFVAAFSGTILYSNSTMYTVNTFNQNSNIEFKLLTKYEDVNYTDGYIEGGGWGCYPLISKDEKTRYTIAGFPDCLDEFMVTDFSTTNLKYSILGISIGTSIEDARLLLKSYRYREVATESDLYEYNKGKLNITLHTKYNNVTEITVYLTTTNIEMVVF